MNDTFAFDKSSLLTFYHLNTLDPTDDWDTNSTAKFDYECDTELNESIESSYAILNNLLIQEHKSHAINERDAPACLQDIPDPLGSCDSTNHLLEKNNISQEERLKYLINSKKFNSNLYLRKIHQDDTFDQLSDSLNILDKSLQNQSEALKQLIQTNFVKYVRTKSNLDRIYDQFDDKENVLSIQQLDELVNKHIREVALKLKPLVEQEKKINNYHTSIKFIQENQFFFNLPKKLMKCLEKRDYSNLMFEYRNAKQVYEGVKDTNNPILERIWIEVENIMDKYRKYTWSLLVTPRENETQEWFLPLILKLIDLQVKDNPILNWIETRLKYFDSQLDNCSQAMIKKILNTRQVILKNGADVDLSFYLNLINYDFNDSSNFTRHYGLTDSSVITEMWLLIMKYVNSISEIVNKFIEFWENVEKFIDKTFQSSLINERRKDNIIENSITQFESDSIILNLSIDEIKQTRKNGENFIIKLCDIMSSLFLSTQDTLGEHIQSNNSKERYSPFDFGFIPPKSNSLTCLRYLPRVIDPILKFTTELAQLTITPQSVTSLKQLDSMILIRSTFAISSTRLRDISNFHTLEDWEAYRMINDEDGDYTITKFSEIVRCFQQYSIKTIRDMLFSFEKLPILNGISIVTYPSKQLLSDIELQQIVLMESVLESILKNATKDKDNPRNSHTILTLTNLQHIKQATFPQILKCFDDSFELNLSGRKLDIFSLLNKMESSIFGNYLSDLKVHLRDILEEKFHTINWSLYSSNSFRASDYIIETLMVLVTVHSECFRIAPQIIKRILKETQIFISKYLFEAFKPFVGSISSDGLLQLIVDIEFFQRILCDLLEKDTKAILIACEQNCFQNDVKRMQTCISETKLIVSSNIERTRVQFASFK